MSLRRAANSLAHISNALDDTTIASLPLVYALAHPLGLAHHAISFATPTAPLDTLQIATIIVATTLTHMPLQISGGGGGGGSGGGGGRGGSDEGRGGGGGSGGSRGGGGRGGGGRGDDDGRGGGPPSDQPPV